MRPITRVVLSVFMICVALTMGVFTLLGFAKPPQAEPEDACYVLGEYGDRLAVYRISDRRTPVTVTNIEVNSLRQADLAEIHAGVITGTEDDMLQILEDLGS